VEQHQKALDAGGDPDITGYTFVDTSNTSMLEFLYSGKVNDRYLHRNVAGHGETVLTSPGLTLPGT